MPEPGPLRLSNGEDAESVEDGAIGPESKSAAFRVSVDLSDFFQQPARCFLWVPQARDSRTVRWLARRLRRAAALRARFYLLCDTHALPPDEPLLLLRPGDALRVVPVEHEWQRIFSFRGERAPPAPPPKPKKRRTTDAAEAESPRLVPLAQSKPPTQEKAHVPIAKRSLPPPEPFLPRSAPTPSPALPTPQPAVPLPSPVQPTTSPAPIANSPSRDEELQRVKRRALALLQKVEGEFTCGQKGEGGEGGEDEPDSAGDGLPPAKKRRRRVRRRRTLPPFDFEQELLKQLVSTTPSSTHAPLATTELPLTSVMPTTPTTSIPAPSLPTPPILAPSIPMPSLYIAPPPGPVVLRGEMTPRPPRLVRALDTSRSEDIGQPNQEQKASTGPASRQQTAVQCS